MPDDPLQRSPQSPASVPTSSNRERALPQTGFYDGPCFSGNSPSTPLASGSKPTLEQLTRSSRGASRRLALVHTVSKQDTLASIALSYGCSQTVLRQSNKLWVSDPVHFRSELAVPLDACTKRPSREVLVEAHLRLEDMMIEIVSYEEPPAAPSSRPRRESAASALAARVADFDLLGSTSESSRGSSRGSSFDLQRVGALQQATSKPSGPSSLMLSQPPPHDTSADSYLASTNNIYANDQLESLPDGPAAAEAAPRDLTDEGSSAVVAHPQVRRTFKLIDIPKAGTVFSASPRPSLTSSRAPSFQLDERLSSPPPPPSRGTRALDDASHSFKAGSTSSSLESWGLSSRRGSGGWAAMDEDEFEMAKDIMRHVGHGQGHSIPARTEVVQGSSPRRANGSRKGLADVLASWTS